MAVRDLIYSAAGAAGEATYVEDVFSTWLYTGNGSTQTITNGIDLAGEGGMVWIKSRSAATDNFLFDTNRGALNELNSNNANAQSSLANSLTAFNANGFSLGSAAGINVNAATYCSWTFAKQPKFFDVVTYNHIPGGGTSTVAHGLGSTPGMIIIKQRNAANGWCVWHRSLVNQNLNLNATDAASATDFRIISADASNFYIGTNAQVNDFGGTYVAYLFAHNAGGFGDAGTDNVISCGSFTTDSSQNATVNLGYEPQYIMFKSTNYVDNWIVSDVMRGWSETGGLTYLIPNSTSAELNYSAGKSPTATGFNINTGSPNSTYIYMAIRRGPMKTPTSGTSVFNTLTRTGTGAAATVNNVGFPPDMVMVNVRGTGTRGIVDKLRGPKVSLRPAETTAEATSTASTDLSTFNQNGISFAGGSDQYSSNSNGQSYVNWLFRRAPGFFDIVCFTSGSGIQNHNLGVSPELVIFKTRDTPDQWYVFVNQNGYGRINQNAAWIGTANGNGLGSNYANVTPTTFSKFGDFLGSASLCVSYLFASVAGVSKVGSYTGTGGTQTINAGLPTGARFVLIKRTDSTGDWFVWDTARGMVAGTDPRLPFSTFDSETNADWVYTTTNGFQIVTTDATVNASGGTYIYLAIA